MKVYRLPSRTGEPPHDRLDAAVRAAEALYPDADACKPMWTPASSNSDVHVEVWQDGRARVVCV